MSDKQEADLEFSKGQQSFVKKALTRPMREGKR